LSRINRSTFRHHCVHGVFVLTSIRLQGSSRHEANLAIFHFDAISQSSVPIIVLGIHILCQFISFSIRACANKRAHFEHIFHPPSYFAQCIGIKPDQRGLFTSTGSSSHARQTPNHPVFSRFRARMISYQPDFSIPLRVWPSKLAQGILKIATVGSPSHARNTRSSLEFGFDNEVHLR
jgi:hypothetical protein